MTAPLRPVPAGQEAAADDPFFSWGDGRIHGCEQAPRELQWLYDQRLLAGRGHVLTGVGGSSKTTALYHLAFGAVLGTLPWSWKVCRTGSAVLFLAEDTIDDMHRSLYQLLDGLPEREQKLLRQRLRVYPLAGKQPILLALAPGQRLVETAALAWLKERIGLLPKPVAFIGIDPALGVTDGDELSPSHQRRLGELVDRIAIEADACAVLTTHAAKSIHQLDELGSHASRGSGAITDAVRGEFTLRSMTADEARRFGVSDIVERRRYVQLAATKGNRMPPEAFAPVWLCRGQGGLLSEVTLDQVERGGVGERERKALEILRATNVQGETAMKFWRAQCEAAGLLPASRGVQAREKAMERIRDALVGAGLVAKGKVRGLWVPT